MREPRREDPAESFGPYLIFECLGRGGMATVHRAKQTGIEGFERPVALKRMLPWLTSDAEFVKSFVREARLAAQLRHTNIVQTYDLGKVDGVYYIAMELVPGRDVRELLRHAHNVVGPPPPPVTINLLFQVCDALDYAHNYRDEQGRPLGLVHRDISPANVLIAEDGTAKIVDFGVAKGSTATLATMSGMLKGKFAYMAPEMVQGQVDARCDLFAVGVVAWELLTARPLFAGGDDMEILQRVTTWDPPAPSTVNPRVPRELDAWVAMALAKHPQRRFQSAAQMRAGLELVARTPAMRASAADVATWVSWAFQQKPGQRPTGAPQIPAPPPAVQLPMPITQPQPGAQIAVGPPAMQATLIPPTPGMPGPGELGMGPIGGADSVAITIDDSTNVRAVPPPAARPTPQAIAARATPAPMMSPPASSGARTMMYDEGVQADPPTPHGIAPPPAVAPPVLRAPVLPNQPRPASPSRPPSSAGQHSTMIGTAIPAAVAAAAAAARGPVTSPPPVIAPGTVPPGGVPPQGVPQVGAPQVMPQPVPQAGVQQRTVLFDGAPPAAGAARASQPGMALPPMPPGANLETQVPAPAGTPAPQAGGYAPPHQAAYPHAPAGYPGAPPAEVAAAATGHLPQWGAGTPAGHLPQGAHQGGPIGGFAPGTHHDGPIGRGVGGAPGPDLPLPRASGSGGLIALVLVLCAGAAVAGYFLIQHFG